jgi:nitrogen regulatory protein P-II 1
MKEIKAVIRPQRLARLREAFRKLPDFPGMTVMKAEGSGYHPDKPADHSIKSELTDYSARVRVEIVSPDALIHDATHTGRAGDGVVWVTPVESFERLRLPLSDAD